MNIETAKTAVDLFINEALEDSKIEMGDTSYPFVLGVLSAIMANYMATGTLPDGIKKHLPETE